MMWSTIEKGVQIKRNSLCYRVAVTQCPSCNWMIARIHLDGTCNELQRDVGTALNLSVTINRERAFLCFCIFVFCVIFKKCVGSTIAPDGYTDCHIKKADSNGLWEWLFILFVPAELWKDTEHGRKDSMWSFKRSHNVCVWMWSGVMHINFWMLVWMW